MIVNTDALPMVLRRTDSKRHKVADPRVNLTVSLPESLILWIELNGPQFSRGIAKGVNKSRVMEEALRDYIAKVEGR